MTSHSDRVKYLADRVAIERNVVKSLKLAGKDATKAEHNLACAVYLFDHNRKMRMDLVKSANIMAREKWFWKYMTLKLSLRDSNGFDDLPDESKTERAAYFIRDKCEIVSFKDLKTNEDAQEKLKALIQEYRDWRKFKVIP